jgi:hypothetical protein
MRGTKIIVTQNTTDNEVEMYIITEKFAPDVVIVMRPETKFIIIK